MKKFKLSNLTGFLLGALFYMAPTSGNAQANIAPLATVTASTCNTGACSTLNDLNLGTCGTQQMWISTSGPPSLVPGVNYIEWVFPSVRSFDSLIIHHAQNNSRFLTGATVQFWDGAAWVTHSNFANLPQNCINRVGIGKLSSDRFRITSFIPGTGQTSNMNFREIEILEAPSGLHDAAVLSLDSPTVYCAGTHNVVATIANFGINQIDSVEVNWSVNGVAQPVVKFIGLLDTISGAGSSTAQVVLGNAAFAAGVSNLQVYTSNPNGQLDTLNFNDTANVAVQTAAAPTNITFRNATLNSVDVNAVGGAGTVDYEFGPLGFAIGTGTSGSSATPNFTISGLSQGTTYDVYVRSNCGSGDISTFVGPQSFNTSYGIPFSQDFENWTPGNLANTAPEGWSRFGSGPDWEAEDATGANENSGNTGPFFDNTTPTTVGGMYVYLECSTGAGVDTLFSPPIYVNPNLTTIEVGFSYHMFGAAMGTLEVYADTNGTRNLLTSFIGQQQANQSDGFIRFSTFLNGYQGKSVQLVFVGIRGTSFTSDMSIDDVTIDPVLPLNAGVIELQNPVGNICPGPVTPVIGVKNFGSSIINSVNVVWDVNGILDSVMYVGTILPGDTAAVSLATLNISSTLVYNLEFYTNRPNNAADQFNADDTLKIAGLQTGLAGTITLDPALPSSATNFTSFAQLEQVLNNYGACGSVVVNVAPGTYNESFSLNNVPGMSSVNTLTIDGGDSSTTTLSHNNSSNYGTVTIVGTDYITIRNMRIEATALNGASILLNNSSHNTFESNILWANPNSTSTNTNYIISGTTSSISTNGVGSYNVLQNNLMVGGYYSIYMYGASAPGSCVGNIIHNNEIDSVYYYGSYIYYQDSLEYTNNTLDQATRGQINGDGMYLYYSSNYNVSGNYIHAKDYGIYFYNFGVNAPTLNGKNRVSNNMVISDTDWGIYFLYETEVDFFHNSVATYGTTNPAVQITTNATNIIDNFDVRNNVFYSAVTEALELGGIPDTIFTKMDNNVYYTGGSTLLNITASTYADLLSYQTAQPAFNASSLDGDPQFLSTTDLHIIGSFINGAGDNSVPIAVDIDGDSRPLAGSTVVDPGADEFSPPLCPPSVNLGATNITLTSADIFWDGVTIDYQYEVVLAGAGQGSGTVIRTALDSVTITGLTPSTAYEFYTREICGRGDTSIWLGPFAFGTANGVPYFQDFEGFTVTNSVFEEGWINRNGTAGPNWQVNTATGSFGTGPVADNTTGISGGKFIYLETSTAAGIDTLVSPPIFIDPTQTVVVLEYFIHMHGVAMGSMEVYVDSNGVLNQLNTLVGQQTAVQTDPWTPYTHTLAGYGGNSIVLKFVGIRGTSYTSDMSIDDVRVFEPSSDDGGVTDILSPTSGCGLGTADSVTVEISNLGTAMIDSIPVVYVLNGGTPVVETYFDSISPGQTANFTFNATVNLSTFGSYSLVAYTDLVVDGDAMNDTTTVSITNIPLVANFPYSEDFETSNGGWTASGANSTWAWGTPAGSVIASAAGGTGAWVTNLTGNYNNNETSFIESPCLDLSSLSVDPILTFSLTYDTESCCDEGWIDYSTDGGLTWSRLIDNGGALEWYNDIGNQWWDGTSSGGAGVWVTAENTLTGLAGQSSVKIRVGFGSDGSVFREGFGIDNIRIDLPAGTDAGIVGLTSPVTGCGLSSSDSVKVQIKNFGSDTLTSTPVSYELNGGAAVTETVTTTILPGDTLEYTFTSVVNLSVPGNYSFKLYSGVVLDASPLNDTITRVVASIPIATFPYSEGFETSNGGWTTSGAASSWAWGTPAGSVIASAATGTGAWVTNLTGSYNNSEASYIESPCFDLSAQTMDPVLRFSLTFDTESCCDEGWVDVSTDGGVTWTKSIDLGGAQNWYNDVPNQWWDGANVSGSGIWDSTSNVLTGVAGFPSVKFRFAFSSDGSVAREGFGVDNVSLDMPVSIAEARNQARVAFSVNPNPSNGLFTLNIETPSEENFKMTVRDAQGRSVYNANFDVNGTYRNDLDFTSFAKGVYYMRIQTETGITVEKLIIQ